jgi:short-chain fatty acids transporter
MLWKFSKRFQFAADRFIPTSFVFCVMLTFIVCLMAFGLTDAGALDLVGFWYNGLWSMLTFAFQMTIMVVITSAVAKSPIMDRMLSRVAKVPKTPRAAYLILIVVTCIAAYINWAFATILAPILSMYMSKNVKGCHFPFMVAVGYACMIMIQPICPSTSAVALLASPDHFLVDKIGVLSVSETAFNPVGLFTIGALFVATILIAIFMNPSKDEVIEFQGEIEDKHQNKTIEIKTPADRMNNSKITMMLLVLAGIVYIIMHFLNGGALTLNLMIFIFLVLAMAIYQTPLAFINAIQENMPLATQVMIQFPFYGGIMGIMASSGLTQVLADGLISIANDRTIYLFSYLSASIVNLFVPSQGGQWIVQGPVLVEAGQALNAHIPTVVTSFMLGDEATNLLQPLYIIPALALVKMELKDAWGMMAFIWFCWTIVTVACLFFLPGILLG